jgi:hypothetical protein
MLALTAEVSWVLAWYKKVPTSFKFFLATEILTGLTAAAAVLRFGPSISLWGAIALLAPVALFLLLDHHGEAKSGVSPPVTSPSAEVAAPLAPSLPPAQPILLPAAQQGPLLTLRAEDILTKVEALPLALQETAMKGYVGARVEWNGVLRGLHQQEEGKLSLIFVCGDSLGRQAWVTAVVSDSPYITMLADGDTIRITGMISDRSRAGRQGIVLDPAEYLPTP